MSKIDDGGPAFPIAARRNDGFDGQSGMTLRDYFAAHVDQPGQAEIIAAAGIVPRCRAGIMVDDLEGPELRFDEWWVKIGQAQRFALYAKVRYALADAMLAERAKAGEQ